VIRVPEMYRCPHCEHTSVGRRAAGEHIEECHSEKIRVTANGGRGIYLGHMEIPEDERVTVRRAIADDAFRSIFEEDHRVRQRWSVSVRADARLLDPSDERVGRLGRGHFVVDLANDLDDPVRIRLAAGRLSERIRQPEPHVFAGRHPPMVTETVVLDS
jgi:hypothetical protein